MRHRSSETQPDSRSLNFSHVSDGFRSLNRADVPGLDVQLDTEEIGKRPAKAVTARSALTATRDAWQRGPWCSRPSLGPSQDRRSTNQRSEGCVVGKFGHTERVPTPVSSRLCWRSMKSNASCSLAFAGNDPINGT